MANLYGRLQGNRGEATRCGNSHITASLETWRGSVRVRLEADGTYRVTVGDKHGFSVNIVAEGKVDA